MGKVRLFLLVTAFFIFSGCRLQTAAPAEEKLFSAELVELKTVVPDVVLDIRYATKNNFTGKTVYPSARCFLKRDAAYALLNVQKDLKAKGFKLKVFDGYRPLSVQKIFWKIMPNPDYVADPAKGSVHNRGYAVDLTLVTIDGKDVAMPTPFDDFTPKAAANYMDLPPDAIKNRKILQDAMTENGFAIFPSEWWHFNYVTNKPAPVLDIDIP